MVHLVLIFVVVLTALGIAYTGNKKVILFFGFGILFVFAALRYGYGNDYWSYYKIYNLAQQGINMGVEPLYYAINKWFPSYQLLIAALSLFYLYAVYKLITKYTKKEQTWIAVLVFLINPYLFLMSLSAVRQVLVCSMFILSLMLNPKSWWTKAVISVVTVGISVFIHKTAILLLPFYYLYYSKRNKKWDYLIFGVLPVVLLLWSDGLVYLIDLVLNLFENNKNYISHLTSGNANSLRATLLSAIIYIYVLLNLNRLDEKTYPIAKLYLCGLMFALLAYRFSMMTRFQMFFDTLGVVTLPAIINMNFETRLTRIKQLLYRYIFPMVVFLIFALRYYSFFSNDLWSSFFEYHTILLK